MIMVSQLEESHVLVIQAIDRLVARDYELLAMKTEEALKQHDKVNVLVELRDFKGWSFGALWKDLKFDIRHFRDIDRLAIVGESKWEQGLAAFSKPFTAADVRYFDLADHDAAKDWVEGKNG